MSAFVACEFSGVGLGGSVAVDGWGLATGNLGVLATPARARLI